ncbi:MAG: 4Fe-4S dicluster domain-containing protein [Treponema sp.]|jgi:predicted aldo/keto reductase-like oxidoreductase|nr:4Fe-4S dicluster domain-containing protein [Treponema sp.]
MPVIIMEPLLGGKLANSLPPEAQEIFRLGTSSPDHRKWSGSPAAWGLCWLWNQSEVTVVLSGMTDPAQVAENAALTDVCSAGSLTGEELALYSKVKDVFNRANKINCTGCAYCLPCPQGVNIPGCFSAYNTSYIMGWRSGLQLYINGTGITAAKSSDPAACISCGKCEKHCPQNIPIIESLKKVKIRMEPLPVRIALKTVRAFLGRHKKSC